MAVSPAQREEVAARASFRCEYCLLHQEHSIKSHHCDHIIPRKHGGTDFDDNLAWACFLCNESKGSEVAAYDPKTGQHILYSILASIVGTIISRSKVDQSWRLQPLVG